MFLGKGREVVDNVQPQLRKDEGALAAAEGEPEVTMLVEVKAVVPGIAYSGTDLGLHGPASAKTPGVAVEQAECDEVTLTALVLPALIKQQIGINGISGAVETIIIVTIGDALADAPALQPGVSVIILRHRSETVLNLRRVSRSIVVKTVIFSIS